MMSDSNSMNDPQVDVVPMDNAPVEPVPSEDRLDAVLNHVQEIATAFSVEAQSLRKDVTALDEKGHRDRKIVRSLQNNVKLLVGALLVLLLMCGGLILIGVSSARSAHDANASAQQLKDCLTPQGQCAQRLAAAGAIQSDLLILRVEDNRITTQIEASKASLSAGSTTAAATIEAYAAQQATIKAQIADKQKQLGTLSPIPPSGK